MAYGRYLLATLLCLGAPVFAQEETEVDEAHRKRSEREQEAKEQAGREQTEAEAGAARERRVEEIEDGAAPPPPPEEKAQPDWETTGFIDGQYRWRNAGGENDHDAYLHFSADATHRGKLPFTARFNARAIWKVDGGQNPGDLLFDTWDNFNGDVQGRLYEAFVRTEKRDNRRWQLQAGRQFLDEGTYLHFDGGQFDLELGEPDKPFRLTLLGGAPVRFGETSRGGNWLAGAVAKGAFTGNKTQWRLEYLHISESFPGINDPVVSPEQQPVSIPAGRLDDDLFGVTLWHRAGTRTRLFGRFNLLNGDPNELHLSARVLATDGGWDLFAEWYQLFQRLNNVTNDLTPYVPMLGSYEPFGRATLRATRRFSERWEAQAGLSIRRLFNTEDEGTFNRQWENYYLSVTRSGFLDKRMDLTVTVDGYDSSGDDFTAVTANLDMRVDDRLSLSGGVDYHLYRYDWFQQDEDENVWTTYLRGRWKWKKNTTLRGGISVDNDAITTWTTVFLKVTVQF